MDRDRVLDCGQYAAGGRHGHEYHAGEQHVRDRRHTDQRANLTFDCCELVVCVNNAAISATRATPLPRCSLIQLASVVYLDRGSGLRPCSGYVTANVGFGGTIFRLPLWIKAGTSIGIATAVNSATVTRAQCVLSRQWPAERSADRAVHRYLIDQFGVSLATSAGTTVTPGTTTRWRLRAHRYDNAPPVRARVSATAINDATMTAAVLRCRHRRRDGNTNTVIIPRWPVATSAIEAVSKFPALAYTSIAANVGLYARAQCSNTPDSANSVAIYGVG